MEQVKRAPSPQELEDAFRESLQEAALIMEVLGPHCSDFRQGIEMLKLGINNDGQLRMLMAMVHDKMDKSAPVSRR